MKTKPKFSFDLFVVEILQDEYQRYSSKRVVAFIGTVALISAFIANTFFGLSVLQYIFDGLLMLVIGALGITVGDAFAYRTKPLPRNDAPDRYVTKDEEADAPVDDPVL